MSITFNYNDYYQTRGQVDILLTKENFIDMSILLGALSGRKNNMKT